MSEVSPWARLGGVSIEPEEKESIATNEEILRLRDQVIELTKMVMVLGERIRVVEEDNVEPIENAFSVLSREELGMATPEVTDDEMAEALEADEVVVIESGFTSPTVEELASKRESTKSEVQPDGPTPVEISDEVVEEKEFGENYATAYLMVDLVTDHIRNNGAILNNQVKKQIYTPNDIDATKTDRLHLKNLIEAGETLFKAEKMDNFRTLYYIGDNADEEYERAFGKPNK